MLIIENFNESVQYVSTYFYVSYEDDKNILT